MAARRPKKKAVTKKTKSTKAARAAKAPSPPQIRPGFLSHTELASADPAATRAWCEEVLGWKFQEMPMGSGETYHMWQFPKTNTGGGIRTVNAPEQPGSIPYVEVKDIEKAEQDARDAGATTLMPPVEVPGSAGFICVVQAPGGVPVGFWGPKK